MQRVLTALLLGGAAAFAPFPVAQRTLTLNASPIDIYSAAEDCLQEECSVDTVQMLVGQLKNREQELAKKGRIVDYEREAALAGVRTMIHDLEGPVRRAASFFLS